MKAVILIAGALLAGILLGAYAPITIPKEWSKYVAVAILAALDTGLGGVRSGLDERFDLAVFASGFTANSLLAAGLTLLGDKLGIDLYLAAIVVFGTRLFENLAKIRRLLLDRYWSA
ncbi:MAG: small basic family protein [Candidatus Sericytochromatia bacterium]|nr:small basic family protein [Candidatus Tanganyikabacteria bacterium]